MILLAGGCSTSTPPAPTAASPSATDLPADPASIQQEYLALQQQAMAEMHAWSPAQGRNPDPRPGWAVRLEEFAAAHPGTPEAGEALSGVMQMRGAMLDVDGFFKDFDQLLKSCPDSPSVAGVFPQVSAMRMLEAGGRAVPGAEERGNQHPAAGRAAPGGGRTQTGPLAGPRDPASRMGAADDHGRRGD